MSAFERDDSDRYIGQIAGFFRTFSRELNAAGNAAKKPPDAVHNPAAVIQATLEHPDLPSEFRRLYLGALDNVS